MTNISEHETETTVDSRFLADWSGLTRGIPAVVHRPANTEQIADLVQQCQRGGRKITIQGGLTGMAGGAVPADGDVVINLERMNAIEWIDDLEGIMQVQAGATLEQVQQAATKAGWFFGVDLGARGSCQVGGNAATNAGGDRVMRYGTMRDSVLGVEVVLADGTVLTSLTRLVKNSTGPDPRFLFIGSEGVFGIITRLTLRLQPMPGPASTALVAAPDMDKVARLLRQLRQSLGNSINAYEFMSDQFMNLACELTGLAPPLSTPAPWYVLIELSGARGQDVAPVLQTALEQALEDELIVDAALASSLSDAEAFWRLRECIPELLTHLKPTVNFDCGLPWAQTGEFVERVSARLLEQFPEATHLFFGHLGDNNIHLMTGPHRPEDMHAVDTTVYSELRGRDGTISAEHGVGFLKKPYLSFTRSEAELSLLRQLKAALDPQNTLNPGRIFD